MSVEQFRAEFSDLARASDALIAAKLVDAEVMTAADYPPHLREQRVKYLAAELLVLSPYGEFARLDPNKEPDGSRSLYERLRRELDRSLSAPMVI